MSPENYFRLALAAIIAVGYLENYQIVREQITDSNGQFRIRVTFSDRSWLELSEFFRKNDQGEIDLISYSYQWMDKNNNLRMRWDNARHYPNLPSFPHHRHDGDEKNVLPGEPMNLLKALDHIAAQLEQRPS